MSDDKNVVQDITKATTGGEGTPATTEVEVKVGEKTVKVAKEVADILRSTQEAASTASANIKTLTQQLAEKDAALEAANKKSAPKEGEVGYDVLLFTDPDKAVEKITNSILGKVEEKMERTQSQQQFWGEFYKQNKDLKDFEGYVNYVFQRDYKTLTGAGVTVGDAIKKLGEAVKADLVKISGKSVGNGKVVAEGGSEGNRGMDSGSKASEGEHPQTTASILKARRAARQEASQPGRKK